MSKKVTEGKAEHTRLTERVSIMQSEICIYKVENSGLHWLCFSLPCDWFWKRAATPRPIRLQIYIKLVMTWSAAFPALELTAFYFLLNVYGFFFLLQGTQLQKDLKKDEADIISKQKQLKKAKHDYTSLQKQLKTQLKALQVSWSNVFSSVVA